MAVPDPLEMAGFSLAVLLGVCTRLLLAKPSTPPRWLLPTTLILGSGVVIGCVILAGFRESTPLAPTQTEPGVTLQRGTHEEKDAKFAIRVDRIDQKVEQGPAVAAIYGDVTVHATATPPGSSAAQLSNSTR
jgi:hypothetical protein